MAETQGKGWWDRAPDAAPAHRRTPPPGTEHDTP
ncbi:Hypothetical protein SCLAV_4366 [Streptomyces clavuligerus]|uniref:Uncharacterized protein n=1 Tax=Streptomyces clavuligerus TaxID=1901 RepID=E2Q7Q7_STRCL|nr:Hypothetical protein SCLAV_4366 [Streptomyces clavuligerus]